MNKPNIYEDAARTLESLCEGCAQGTLPVIEVSNSIQRLSRHKRVMVRVSFSEEANKFFDYWIGEG